jgi:hypothetical protein
MPVQTYCSQSDIESLIGVEGVVASVDDSENGANASPETTYITDAIERGAVEINGLIIYQYRLADVASNAWLKWANAWLAAYHLRMRRGNEPEPGIAAEVQEIRRILNEIRWGRFQLSGQLPSFNVRPTVSTLTPELWRTDNPIRVDVDESVGGTPPDGIKRNTSGQQNPAYS